MFAICETFGQCAFDACCDVIEGNSLRREGITPMTMDTDSDSDWDDRKETRQDKHKD